MGVALKDILSDYKHVVVQDDLKGIAAIDAYNALYQFLSIIRQPDGTPLMDKAGRITSHLSGIFFRTVNFLEMGIQPVWVFDGAPPELKTKTIEDRRQVRETARERWDEAKKEGDLEKAFRYAMASAKVDEAVITSAKQLLSLMGIPVVHAPSEGEAQAAYMALRGDVTYVVSQDYDSLLFGAPRLVRNLTISGKRRFHGRLVNIQPEEMKLDEILNGLVLSREDLIRIAILVGTDFNTGASGIGAKTGLKKVKKGEFHQVISEKLPELNFLPIHDFFMNPPVSDDYLLEWKTPDTQGIITFLCDEYGFSPDRVTPVLEKIGAKKKQKTLDSWF